MTSTLLLFTLNERDGMRAILPQLDWNWFDKLLVVDGGSTDGTLWLCKELGLDYFVQKEKGTGNAFKEALEKIDTDVLVVFSPDGNSLPIAIPYLIEHIKNGADICIASRYLGSAKSYDDDFITSFGNKMFTCLVRWLFKINITDALVMYRAYNVESLKSLNVKIDCDAWGTKILIKAKKRKMKIKEIAASEPKRIGGVRKMNPLRNGWWELRTIWREIIN